MFIGVYNNLVRVLYPIAIRRYIEKRKKMGKEDKPINEYLFVPFTLYGGEDSPEFNGFPENIVVTGTLKGDDVKITKSKNQY
jgi:hypothetical protein